MSRGHNLLLKRVNLRGRAACLMSGVGSWETCSFDLAVEVENAFRRHDGYCCRPETDLLPTLTIVRGADMIGRAGQQTVMVSSASITKSFS